MGEEGWAALLFVLSCNLDTAALALSFTARGWTLPRGGVLVIALGTTAVTWLSLLVGQLAAEALAVLPGVPDLLGGAVLAGLGLWFLLDALRQREETEETRPDSLRACAVLAGALAVNNAGAGAAAGVSGVSPLWAGCLNFLVTLLSLRLGRGLGRRLPGSPWGRLALPLSGLLLLALGLLELLLP